MATPLQLPDDVREALQSAPFEAICDLWFVIEQQFGDDGRAWLGRNDRFYLLTRLLHRVDAVHPWLYARCREVEKDTDGYLDLWAREHYKSTLITYTGIIQELLNDPELTIGIFSHTKGLARDFLKQIKRELESNDDLKALYPEILWSDPQREAPQWSIDGGIVVKRKSNPKEQSVEGHGLVDGQPTGKHFGLLVYDDVVTLESIGTPDQVKKTTEAWALSDNLGARNSEGRLRKWHIGTRYSYADSYAYMLDNDILKPRIFAATDNGLIQGNPVFLTPQAWAEKVKAQPPAILAAQMLQNPSAGNQAMFRKEWLSFMDVRPATLNIYIMCDPAHSKKKGSDNTAFAVVGIDAAGNKFLLDGARHKMNLRERWEMLKGLRRIWLAQPGVQLVKCGYERYGMQADLEYFEEQMRRDRESFEIVELGWTSDGAQSKDDRVQRLVPDFMSKRFHLAAVVQGETAHQKRAREAGQAFRIFSPVKRKDHEGNLYSLNRGFLDEFLQYPFSAKKDLIDATSRIYDMDPVPPILIDERTLEPDMYADGV